LLTKEGVQLYFDRLEDDGLLALHISNRYLELEPVVDRIAKELGVEARVMHHTVERGSLEEKLGKTSSTWIALAKTREALGSIDTGRGSALDSALGLVASSAATNYRNPWGRLNPEGIDSGLWTDNYSPILCVLKFLGRSGD
jgi:hypothetical protein